MKIEKFQEAYVEWCDQFKSNEKKSKSKMKKKLGTN